MTENHKQHVLTLNLQNDPDLIRQYEQYHQPNNVWPEIIESIRAAGIYDMRIYRLDTLLVMVLSTSSEFSFEKKAKLDADNLKVQQWERLMERFQRVDTSKNDKEKWRLLSSVFSLHDH